MKNETHKRKNDLKDRTRRCLFSLSFYGGPILGGLLGAVFTAGLGGILLGLVVGFVLNFALFQFGLHFLPTLFAEENFRREFEEQ